MKKLNCILALCLIASFGSDLLAQTSQRTLTRLIWQDRENQELRWGDLKYGSAWGLSSKAVGGQPKLDADKQTFVQMKLAGDTALVGVRDTEDGEFQSGWFAVSPGVIKEAHGDHFHWRYRSEPAVVKSMLDDKQGNPAHVYLYDGAFYIANDKKNGFTQVYPSELKKPNPGRFFQAGGGHITLAAVSGKVGYSTWIDRGGDNMGRVDVVGLGSSDKSGYHFHLPSGGIHGATTNAGKVFFAPTDGICWVKADLNVTSSEEEVDVHHLSLGKDSEGNPKRTGAFSKAGNTVVFTIGRTETPELCMLNAASPKPSVQKLAIDVAEGNSLTTPATIQSRTGAWFALTFEESATGENAEKLHVIALDPNRDGNCADAKMVKTIVVGRSLIEGHSGHHEAVPIGRRYVAITNPGDGTIAVISTRGWNVETTLKVDGVPTRLISIGG